MSKETQRQVKAVGTRPGITTCKVHKKCVCGCLPFRTILSALQTLTYELPKFLVSILKPWTTKKSTPKICLNLPLKLLSKIPITIHG